MKNKISEVMSRLRRFGVKLVVNTDKIEVQTCTDLPDDSDVDWVHAHKSEIEHWLQKQPDYFEFMPLEANQTSLLLHYHLYPGSKAYNMANAARLLPGFKPELLEQSFLTFAAHHESLHSAYMLVDGLGLLDLREKHKPEFLLNRVENWSDEQIHYWLTQRADHPFGLELGQVCRLNVLVNQRDGRETCYLVFGIHHIAGDYRSFEIMVDETLSGYGQLDDGKDLEFSEVDVRFSQWLAVQEVKLTSGAGDKSKQYWLDHLAGEIGKANLTQSAGLDVKPSYEGAEAKFRLSRELTRSIRGYSEQLGATPFIVFLAAFQLFIYRYSGCSNFLTATPTTGRNWRKHKQLVGYTINPILIKSDFSTPMSFGEFIYQLGKTLKSGLRHKIHPYPQLARDLRVDDNFLSSQMFTLVEKTQIPGIDRYYAEEILRGERGAAHGLNLVVEQGSEHFDLSWRYNTSLFDADELANFQQSLEKIIQMGINDPSANIFGQTILAEPQLNRLRKNWEKALAPVDLNQDAIALFEQQADARAQKIAVSFSQGSLSYQALNEQANQLAHWLIARGVGPDTLVALCSEREPWMLIALLAIQKAGGAYVPLDPHHPVGRIQAVLDQAKPALVLTTAAAKAALPVGADAVDLDGLAADLANQARGNPAAWVSHHQLAYTLFTSGSTGKPKGVQISRGSFVNHLQSMQEKLALTAEDNWLAVTTVTFDIAGLELFLPLVQGAHLVVAEQDQTADAEQLIRLWETQQISVMQATPVTWQFLVEKESSRWQGMKVLCGGEALPSKLAQSLLARNAKLLNVYGPTETTVWSSSQWIGDGNVNLGQALMNNQLYVLDEYLNPVPQGVVGELYIGGLGLARGYMDRPELTATAFIPNQFAQGSQCDTGGAGSRLYRTGDLVRSLADGSLVYLGRTDFQVKVRGFRIELGEIEGVLGQETDIERAVVVSRDERLVAYVTCLSNVEPDTGAILERLKAQLPDYMVPSLIMTLEEFPLNSNGKVDRKELPAPDFNEVQKEYQAPETETELQLAEIWQELLQVERVGRTDNFFELGGHSLLATRLASQIERQLGRQLPLVAIFEAATLKQQAERLRKSVDQGLPPITKTKRTEKLPLSFAQQRMWMLEQLEGGQAYLMPGALKLEGQVDIDALRLSFADLLERHEALRTRFVEFEGEAYQYFEEICPFKLGLTDLSASSNQEAELAELVERNANEIFDLSRAPLLRAHLVKLNAGKHVLLFALHHIIGDEWSSQLLINELSQAYASRLAGQGPDWPVLEVQYVDYALWQREWLQGEALEAQLNYWREQLGEQHPVLELPYDYARPAEQSFDGDSIGFTLPHELSLQVQKFSREQGYTLHQFLLGSFQLLLAKYSGQQEVRVGVPIANRTRGEIEGVVGCFINTQVMALSLNSTDSLLGVLNQVKERAIGAQAHQDIPFEKLVEALNVPRDLSHSPLFQVMFNLQQAVVGKQSLELEGLTLTALEDKNTSAKFDLTLDMTEEGGELSGSLEYCTALFKSQTIKQIIRHYLYLLNVVVSQPDTRLSNLQLMDQTEQVELARVESQSADYELAESWLNRFAKQVQAKPEAIVVTDGQGKMTLIELDRLSTQVAAELQQIGIASDDVVAILAERNRAFIVSLVGILKAGAAWLPLSPSQPAGRWQQVLDGAKVKAVLADEQHISAADQHLTGYAPVLNYQTLLAGKGEFTPVAETPGQLAYVLFTSGSTGTPKGVMVSREGMLNNMLAKVTPLGLSEADIIAQTAGQCFDICVWQMLTAPILGCRVHIVDEETVRDPQGLTACLGQHAVTITELVPSLLQALLETETGTLNSLRWVLPTGEALPPALATSWFSHYPHIPLMNAYGPAECADDVAFAPLYEAPDESVVNMPIGLPTANASLYVVDGALNRVPTGVVGELAVGGVGIGRGYRQAPGKTAAVFVPNSFNDKGERLYLTGDLVKRGTDGQLEYIGRKDFQVKIRGQRIELGEIEAALEKQAGVKQAIVTASEVGGSQHLVAYISGEAAGDSELRQGLGAVLPGYMVPSLIVRLTQLPLSSNGKVDRKALPAPDFSAVQKEYQAPETETERQLAAIWQELLQVEKVGKADNFFELGGNSLSLIKLKHKLSAQFGLSIELAVLFEKAALSIQAEHIEIKLGKDKSNIAIAEDLLAELEVGEW